MTRKALRGACIHFAMYGLGRSGPESTSSGRGAVGDMKKSQAMRDGDPIRQITKMLKLDEPNQQGAMSNLSLDLTWREV